MSYRNLRALLERLFARLNAANAVPSPDEVARDYALHIDQVLRSDEVRKEFTSLGGDIQIPKALEAARILQHLRQRFDANEEGESIVGRIRGEVVQRERPRQGEQARDETNSRRPGSSPF